MLRSQFEEDLTKLHDKFDKMGQYVNTAINKSVKAFIDHDKSLAKEVIAEDDRINAKEQDLEKKCFEMIALQQPVTLDLRKIVTIMKASSDLERMGDHAVSIAKSTIRVKGNKRVLEIENEISEMATHVMAMVSEVLVAYVNTDSQKAIEIAMSDKVTNQYFKSIYRHSIEAMQENPETVIVGADYLQVAGFLERIGDYVTNICEWIVYLTTGKIEELDLKNFEEN
ncbi:phosphate signaling complex protein PhoU [Vagococcus fluvialis]|jgi:phosphate transport system protein|uniref:Phosphate-specific transport system accessory protein PhoU n=1 Tax=Vagococcus fluvialis TaxID=2738 RepID=A0A369AXN9_9ENTE|nr:phosphate signaling complex protein PhoU [Vagococcus fluvialis]MDR2276696.1 phosphate signaling complex protein PhoU [Vagococcus sp.]OTP34306.1 phosphate transport system regulatory protein PhoU [Enterococcus sp. 6C8_DIV0013]MBO0419958.1 phosphate signaling complex protein PhoU [Vagococcus fluvialis]MBO0427735.1 phosphate signaling complex protein PhoU [Vagococcus fluvialis]MBO0438638.1 phosphate signaling complex protein PhoU [Vagococcus fluvialis]